MAITAGGHTFDLVNDTLAFHSRASATVRPGEMATITVTPPTGHMSVNALPWAEVWIDGKQAGETPLGNLSLPIGEHQVVFRHPQFPEQHQTAIVRAEGITRVSANLQR